MKRIKTLGLTNPQIRLLLQLYEISQSGGHKTYSRMPDMIQGMLDKELVNVNDNRVTIAKRGVWLCQN